METDKDAVTAAVIVQQVNKQGRSRCPTGKQTRTQSQQPSLSNRLTNKNAVVVQLVNTQGRSYSSRHCPTG
jgi:hypothetical protein